MKITFHNKDYDKVSVSILSGTTNSNFGLRRGESHELEFTEAVLHAWWPKDEAITVAQIEQYGSEFITDTKVNYGNPLGIVELT